MEGETYRANCLVGEIGGGFPWKMSGRIVWKIIEEECQDLMKNCSALHCCNLCDPG